LRIEYFRTCEDAELRRGYRHSHGGRGTPALAVNDRVGERITTDEVGRGVVNHVGTGQCDTTALSAVGAHGDNRERVTISVGVVDQWGEHDWRVLWRGRNVIDGHGRAVA